MLTTFYLVLAREDTLVNNSEQKKAEKSPFIAKVVPQRQKKIWYIRLLSTVQKHLPK